MISTLGEIVEEAVELVGHVGVVERGGMGVVPQGRGRIPVAEAGLGLEQPPVVDLWVPRTSSSSRDQAIFVDQATGASLPSDAVLLKIDRFG